MSERIKWWNTPPSKWPKRPGKPSNTDGYTPGVRNPNNEEYPVKGSTLGVNMYGRSMEGTTSRRRTRGKKLEE